MASGTKGAALVALLLSAIATAHEHPAENIKTGSAVSEDPIVREDNRTELVRRLIRHRTLSYGYTS